MSSPAHRRRSSAASTPRRTSLRQSSQPVPSSPPDAAAAQLLGEAASSQASREGRTSRAVPRSGIRSSSPVNYPSSSSGLGGHDVGSPLGRMHEMREDMPLGDAADGDHTPRARSGLARGEP
jgi:hypothetical protein